MPVKISVAKSNQNQLNNEAKSTLREKVLLLCRWTRVDTHDIHVIQLFMHVYLPCKPEQIRCDMTMGNYVVTLKALTSYVDTVVKVVNKFHVGYFHRFGLPIVSNN